jgi:uncharacterized protein (DUF58 family)
MNETPNRLLAAAVIALCAVVAAGTALASGSYAFLGLAGALLFLAAVTYNNSKNGRS